MSILCGYIVWPNLHFPLSPCRPGCHHQGIKEAGKKKKNQLLSDVWLFATPWTIAFQAPLSMGLTRQEYWSGQPCPFSRGSSWPKNGTWVSCIGSWILYCLSHQVKPLLSKRLWLRVTFQRSWYANHGIYSITWHWMDIPSPLKCTSSRNGRKEEWIVKQKMD